MRKFQFFLIVETILLVLALMTILTENVPRFIFLVILLLLSLKYYKNKNASFLLTCSLLIFFLIMMLNPYFISAVILAITYSMLNHFSQVKHNNRLAHLAFKTGGVTCRKSKQQWFGQRDYPEHSDTYSFDDIDVIRISGSDTIDLSQVILSQQDNVIVIRKVYGLTRILVPIDVAVHLKVSTIYGSVTFFDDFPYDLRNEIIALKTPDYDSSRRSVKVIISNLAGDTKVRRR